MTDDPHTPATVPPASPTGEDRTVVVHDDLDRPEVRAAAPERAAAMRRLAADMTDVMAIRPCGTAHPDILTAQASPGTASVVVTLSAQVLDGWTLRTWTVASDDDGRPDDVVAILLPRIRGVSANRTPEVDQIHRLATIIHRAADVLERPADHPTEDDWIAAVLAMLDPIRPAGRPSTDMVVEANHLSASPVSDAMTRIWMREAWRLSHEPERTNRIADIDLPEAMLLTMIGEELRPTLEAVETTLGDDTRRDPVGTLRALAALDRNPVWRTHRERTRRP